MGGGATKRESGGGATHQEACDVLPLQKGVVEKVLAMLKGGGETQNVLG